MPKDRLAALKAVSAARPRRETRAGPYTEPCADVVLQAQEDEDEFEVEMAQAQENAANAEFFATVEKVMEAIDKMKADVEEVKRTQSAILSSPSTDDSKCAR